MTGTYSTIIGSITTHSNSVAARTITSQICAFHVDNLKEQKQMKLTDWENIENTHSMPCITSTSWVFWSGVIRANTVALSINWGAPVWRERVTASVRISTRIGFIQVKILKNFLDFSCVMTWELRQNLKLHLCEVGSLPSAGAEGSALWSRQRLCHTKQSDSLAPACHTYLHQHLQQPSVG